MPKVNKLFATLLGCWFLMNLLQAVFTGIHSDEVYYAIWGRHLAWGYFDHPPMVAVLTYLSSLLFDGHLGVRFVTVLLQLATLLLLWNAIRPQYRQTTQSVWIFFIVAASLVMFSVYGFTTTPDTPFLFFAALFLYAYRHFLQKNTIQYSLLLAIAMAGMCYSKYHAVLVIGFTVLSNFKLLKNSKFWLAGIVGLVLLVPHFWWQYANDFPSFQYHLVSRSKGFEWKYFFEFFPGQLGIFNPFTFGAVVYALWKWKPQSDFERTLYFLILGILGFFTLSTLRGRAEAHWTVAASLPMLVLLVERASEHLALRLYILRYVGFSLVLVVVARGILVTDFSEKFGYEDHDDYYKNIEKIAGGRPVLFNGSFQPPSFYQYYTGKPASVVSAIENRQTQYDIWQFEQDFIGKEALLVTEKPPYTQVFDVDGQLFNGMITDQWQTSNRLRIRYELDKQTLKGGTIIEIPIEISNPTATDVVFDKGIFSLAPKVVFLVHKRHYYIENVEVIPEITHVEAGAIQHAKLRFEVPAIAPGEYKFSVVINSFFGHTLNSDFVKISVE
ncbi:MAG: glycosyltransferase family 39 protein [Capnocytophaga sp.]|nr:glycosyltransferase family 39 protein [Capnocytophaga sp.]